MIWIFDNRHPANPVSICDLSDPDGSRLQKEGRPFRPAQYPRKPARQLCEFRADLRHLPECRSARVRYPRSVRPTEIGALVPPAAAALADHRPNRARVIQSADVFVDEGLIYATDYNAGLYIMEFGG